eukprot:CAMPEP_0201902406 /NCGR_PEP_ID=MMETSP0902-20130614/54938_1 /ASSEMBLY_ACC=CAM_ASM_000551 /TAXON_ID=420261 /ORGANISM="Thalassiosira antarctica, Strain CCMP982" /LENGTH=568 /DNA_ID=CAMNT_0048436405 /DNA_START=21 /DNA_END=1728 /DNA_ORIENTATION=-
MNLCRGITLTKALSATFTMMAVMPLATKAQTPTSSPTAPPTLSPSSSPTTAPTLAPTSSPTTAPTSSPSSSPTQSPTVLIGCPPLWTSVTTGDIDPGTLVSHPDDSTGAAIRVVYECKDHPYNLYCPQSGFEPGTLYSPMAWIRLGKCNSAIDFEAPTFSPTNLPTFLPTFSLWEKEGCPELSFDTSLATAYATGEVVEYEGDVYECVASTSARCNQAGWEPVTQSGRVGAGHWRVLGGGLDNFGEIAGSIAPTETTTLYPLWEKVGCPEEYNSGETYADGSVVSSEKGVVYKCKPFPDEGHCNTHSPDSDYGYLGWETLGSCVGTLSPTLNPTANPTNLPTLLPTHALWETIGCPPEFDASLATAYATGEVVALDEVVYECVASTSARCNQAGWEPVTGEYWEEAWMVLGSCTGTIVPTASPSREILPPWENTGCPEEYTTDTTYEEGDNVSAYESRVFECKPWPDMGFCNMFPPEDEENGDLGWMTVGGCDGTLAPTDAPTVLPEVIGCSAPAYDSSASYMDGDLVQERGDIYECNEWPYSLWCNNPVYMPGTDIGSSAWTKTGPC